MRLGPSCRRKCCVVFVLRHRIRLIVWLLRLYFVYLYSVRALTTVDVSHVR